MLAVRAELHLEVAVLGVEEEGLHHLVVELQTKVPEDYAPTRAFTWLKAPTSASTFKSLC